MLTLLRAGCVLMILSGIAGVVVGGQSAAAGWRLIVVFGGLLLLTFVGGGASSASTDGPRRLLGIRPVTIGLAIVAAAVVVPVALLMVMGA